jgi:hypothetical protein
MDTPGREVVLHIGAMKTGTTYVQNLLGANRKALASQGWDLPRQPLVVRGVRQVLGLTDAGPRAVAKRTPGWDELVGQLRDGPGRGALLSMEFLSYAHPDDVERILAGLGDLAPKIVLTVRDATGAIPSQWQSLTRNRGLAGWPDFAVAVRSEGRGPKATRRPYRAFERTQGIVRMLETWSAAVPPDRLYVVTVPRSPAPRDLLWHRLLSVAGVDAEQTRTEDVVFGNPRLGYGSCELIRRLNASGLRDVPPSAYRRAVRFVARNHLLPLRAEESEPRLDAATAEHAVVLNARARAAAERHATVVGDLDDLPVTVDPERPVDPGREPAPVPDAEVGRAAEAALQGARAYCAELGVAAPAERGGSGLDARVAEVVTTLRTAIDADLAQRRAASAADV